VGFKLESFFHIFARRWELAPVLDEFMACFVDEFLATHMDQYVASILVQHMATDVDAYVAVVD